MKYALQIDEIESTGYRSPRKVDKPKMEKADGQLRGTIVKYVDGKGYGFIEQNDGGEDLFFHIKSVNGSEPVEVGDAVSFDASEGKNGKWAAINIAVKG